jgi:hypothetical protein
MMKIAGIVAAAVACLTLEGCKSDADQLADFKKSTTQLKTYEAKFAAVHKAGAEEPTAAKCLAVWTELTKDKEVSKIAKQGKAVEDDVKKLNSKAEDKLSADEKTQKTNTKAAITDYMTNGKAKVVAAMNACFEAVDEDESNKEPIEDAINKVLPVLNAEAKNE